MAKLKYSVHVAPAKLVVSDDFPPGETREMWSPTASTLIYGERDAILVDPLMTKDESRALADWVVATGKNVTAIFVTHAHGDHFFGAPAVLERFPDAKVVAAPGVAARMDAQYGLLDGFWNLRFPGQISGQRVTAEPLTDGLLELEESSSGRSSCVTPTPTGQAHCMSPPPGLSWQAMPSTET
jgi:glyoxylase-like metal-dependent hydrolase (beta-lactamase superfamily II)